MRGSAVQLVSMPSLLVAIGEGKGTLARREDEASAAAAADGFHEIRDKRQVSRYSVLPRTSCMLRVLRAQPPTTHQLPHLQYLALQSTVHYWPPWPGEAAWNLDTLPATGWEGSMRQSCAGGSRSALFSLHKLAR